MDEKELYQQKKQAELDQYGIKLKELKEELSAFDADANRELDKQINILELKLKEGKIKLEAFVKANKEEFESHKKAVDDAFISINTHLAMS